MHKGLDVMVEVRVRRCNGIYYINECPRNDKHCRGTYVWYLELLLCAGGVLW